MGIRFALVGAWELTADGTVLPPLRPRQRTVLALLAARANRTVTIDAVVAEVWSDRPPEASVANVRTYVNAIRNVLGPAFRHRLCTMPAGYRLVLEPGETDLDEIQTLAALAHHAAGQGRVDDAEHALDEAAALMDRGAPLEDVPRGATLAALRDALEEQFVALREDRFAAKVAAGRSSRIVGELVAHVEAHPLREQAYGWLMRARHAAGNLPEALRVYRDARRVLHDELGLEPGPQLQALHRAMLSGAAPTDGLAAPGAPTAQRAPRMLPRDIAEFVGREHELRRIEDALRVPDRVAVVALHGVGGAGKSAVMIRAAHRHRDRYPDGQLYVDLRASSPGERPTTVAEALSRLLRALGTPPAAIPDDEVGAAELYHTTLAGRRILVLVDNAGGAAVEPLIPRTVGSAALLTSRQVLASLNGATHIPVGALPAADAAALLRRLGGAPETEPAVDEVAELCGRLALPLRVTAARRASRPDWTYADLAVRLAVRSARLDELSHDDIDVRAILKVSYDVLAGSVQPRDQASAEALRIMGALPFASITAPLLAEMTGTGAVEARRALDGLVTARLADSAQARYLLHDLTRLLAAELADAMAPEERAEALTRAFNWYLRRAEAAARVLRPAGADGDADPRHGIGSAEDALAFLDEERTQLLAVAELAGRVGEPTAPPGFVRRMLDSVNWHWSRQGYWADEQRLAELAVDVAARGTDRLARAEALLALARVEGRRRRLDSATAHLTQARDFYDGSPEGTLSCEGELGLVARFAGDYRTALGHLERALDLCRSTGARRKEAVILLNMAMTLGALGDLRREHTCLEESLAIRIETGDRIGEALVLVSIGPLLASLGDWARAEESINAGLVLCEELGMPIDAAYARTYRSVVHLRAGRPRAALADATAAHAVLETVDDPEFLSRVHRQIGRAHDALGHVRQARTSHAEATRLRASAPAERMADMELFFDDRQP